VLLNSEDQTRPRPIQAARNIDKYVYRGIWIITKMIGDIDYAIRVGSDWEEDAMLVELLHTLIERAVHENLDLSSNDATQHAEERQETDVSLLTKIMPKLTEEWADLESEWTGNLNLTTHQVASVLSEGDFYFTMFGKQNTGKNDTTLGNSHRNAERIRFLLYVGGFKEVEIHTALDEKGKRYVVSAQKGDWGFLVLGDDAFILMIKKAQEWLRKNWHVIFAEDRNQQQGLGHWRKKEISSPFYDFCSRDCIKREDGTFRWIRKLKRFLQTTPFTISLKETSREDIKEFELRKLAYIEGIGMLHWCQKLPLFHKYALTLIRLGVEVDPKIVEETLNTKWNKRSIGFVTTMRDEDYGLTLKLWEDQYNISKEAIVSLEKALDECNSLHDQILHPEIINAFNFTEEYNNYAEAQNFSDLYV